MAEKRTTKGAGKGRARGGGSSKASGSRKTGAGRAGTTFPQALESLLRSRKLAVPAGLADAPAAAYASQPASLVDELAKLDDATLLAQAEKIAGYATRQAERARRAWEDSPLIRELRRRKLAEPPRPSRVVGAAFSLKKPLSEWSDRELVTAANEWSERGR